MGCSQRVEADEESSEAAISSPRDWDRAVVRPATETAAADARRACRFARGAMPAETLGAEIPVGDDIPIKNIVVMMQENRSFDSYFGHLNKYAGRTDIESAPDDASNPENVLVKDSPRQPWKHADRLCMPDTNHEWAGSHLSWNAGHMDGFLMVNRHFKEGPQPQLSVEQNAGERAMWWYDERDIPFYYELASTFTIGDHYHSSLLGPTWPNRDYLYAATSRGMTEGHTPNADGYDFPNGRDLAVFDMLERRHVRWKVYVDSFPHVARLWTLFGISYLKRWGNYRMHFDTADHFFDDAKNGTLPEVAFVDGKVVEDVVGNDEHPPADIQIGEKFVSDIVHALFRSPQWKQLALFLLYDEHGGIYDHVAPPKACVADEVAAISSEDEDALTPGVVPGQRSRWAFDRLGVRVPFTVVSPYAKKGHVTHDVYDHTSITRFIEAKFGLPALTNRDANALPPFDAFDFANPPFLTPPTIRDAQIDKKRRDDCTWLFSANPEMKTTFP